METVCDTPVKRRRTETGHVAGSQAYDSQDDSGDNLFDEYETVATLPLPMNPSNLRSPMDSLSSPGSHITQPTQIINKSIPRLQNSGRAPSIVEVAASSPIRVATASSPLNKQGGGVLANTMAPPGTSFRLPMGIVKPPPKPAVIHLSDDEGPTYRGMSSDEDSQRNRRVDIKPSTFIRKIQESSYIPKAAKGSVHNPPSNGPKDIREITSKSFYKPLEKEKGKGSTLSGSIFDSRNRDENNTTSRIAAPGKRSADVMANAYGGSSRPPKHARQTGPAKAQPVQDLDLDEIEDFQLRTKIRRMRDVDPKLSVLACRDALYKSKFNTDDAMAFLTSQEPHPPEIDLTMSEEDQSSSQISGQLKVPAKQQIKAPIRSIQEKWSATQGFPRNTEAQVSSTVVTLPKPQRRRLVQGRKRRSSPAVESPKASFSAPVVSSLQQASPQSEDDSDSGIGSEPEEDRELDGKVLHFFNTCSISDLADIAAISEEVASVLLSRKPFKNLDDVRQISAEGPLSKVSSKRKTTKKPIGDKIVDKCLEMWTGYEAVDELVRRCEALGKPVAEEMKKWGVDVFGASKGGELELVTFDDIKSESQFPLRDSGIGTPTSGSVSMDEEGDTEVKKAGDRAKSKQAFFAQPLIMGDRVVLKDYQIVGVNWLSLLFEKQLSCILADDMGLGKTCQVIAFLAHLLEKGVKGPHLVVVPGSTLENWLREFSVFCPKLSVIPYYGKTRLICLYV